jgi:chromosome partitioning protein
MSIIACGGIKGGAGKTTVAVNFAIMRALAGHDVLLVDANIPQQSATDFTTQRSERFNGDPGYTLTQLNGMAVRNQTLRQKDKYSDVIIDLGGHDSVSQRAALGAADLLIVPFVPRSFDIWTIDQVISMVQEMQPANDKLRTFIFINKADARGSDNDDAEELLREKLIEGVTLIPQRLGNRKAFANAGADGLAITEYKPRDAQAIEDMTHLYKTVFDALDEKGD